MTPLRFYDFMRAGHVKRWHIVNTVREQTVAEHSFLVAIIALELNVKLGAIYGGDLANRLLLSALFADASEIRTGDYPTPAKREIREVLGGRNVFAEVDAALMPKVPYYDVPPSTDLHDGEAYIRRIVKMADTIEAAHWINENKAGFHADVVAKGCSKAVAELVVKFTEETKTDWFKPVNEILMELGMPYISNSLRMTPP